ncbi:alpha/beta hydrolase [Acinetobacter sp. NIPH 1852]|uniref:BRO-N domain-containing protein n=1 Tax=Acinetobacter sp. NIPH 1852 TaxID=2923428 RepID=UPI001F4BA5C6|nr:BRO family protein [Acinetobacter sp. NIPH 1852]MCH7308367.1 alpha/beta hydrolase [Acinetobacter sp. NIPH 1852]
MNSLSFNAIQFHPIQQNDDQIWITSSELAKALGYSDSRSVTKIYNRYSDEFLSSMTTVVNLATVRTTGLIAMDNRIFSLRGAHLIAMFARTPVAKDFRKWVLDILEKESKPQALTDIRDRIPLAEAVAVLVSKSNFNTVEVYKMINQRFDVDKVDEIPQDVLPFAVEYVHNLTAVVARSNELQRQDQHAVQQLVEAVIQQNFKMMGVWNALRYLNPNDFFTYSGLIVRSNQLALKLSKRYNLKGENGEPLVSQNFRQVSFSNGELMETNPNWFNAPA